MDKMEVLWIDLRANRDGRSYCRYLKEDWKVSYKTDTASVDMDINRNPPSLLCFEFDYPNIPGLTTLHRLRHMLPMLPVIMLTEQHSESLAVWALRARVWDYFVKPLSYRELKNSAAIVLTHQNAETAQLPLSQRRPNPLPAEVRFRPCEPKCTYPALAYVENHSHEKIYEKRVAQICGMNPTTFSRCFKQDHGITFRDYLANHRLNKARELLQNPNASVTDIAHIVGFHDPSYFTRIFRHKVGISPSHYRVTGKPGCES